MLKMKTRKQEEPKVPEVLHSISGSTSELVRTTSTLSNFDVQIHHVSGVLTEYTEEMRNVSESNLAVIEETTARMNNVNGTVTEATGYLDGVTETAATLAEKNTASKELLDEVENLKENVLKDSKGMSQDIEQLVKLAAEIDRIVESVQGIASQTNLLALNAAIEAARAGEHGKGFAVVAEEVRQLADDTKQNLEGMRAFVDQIQNAAAKSRDSLQTSMDSIENMGDKIGQVHTTIAENVDLLQDVVEDVVKINRSMHGINEATTEIEQAMEENSREAEKLTRIAQDIGQSAESNIECANEVNRIDKLLSEVSKHLFDDVRKGGRRMTAPEFTKIIEDAKRAHMAWLNNLKSMTDKMQIAPLQTDGDRCAFGHFYGVITIHDTQMKELWKQIGAEHRSFHSIGKNVLNAIKADNRTDAMNGYKKADDISVKLMKLLDDAAAFVDKVEKSGESVF